MPDWLAGALIAFGVAAVSTPAGVSSAVFLLPVQVSVLHVPNPALTRLASLTIAVLYFGDALT